MEKRDPMMKGFLLQVKKSQMKKQLQRISGFGRFLPFEEQQHELSALVKKLDAEITLLNRYVELFTGTADEKLLTEVGEKLLMHWQNTNDQRLRKEG